MSYSLILREPLKRGTMVLLDGTNRISGWRRSIRRIGGFWSGSGVLVGPEVELMRLFYSGICGDLLEVDGGITTWNGFISEMTLRQGDYSQRRSMLDIANAVRIIYTSIGDNLLTNGGGESGVWTAYNGATITQSTTWRVEGTYSIRVQAGGASQGAYVQQNVSISSLTGYALTLKSNLVSGTWLLSVIRTDTLAALGEIQITSVGDATFTVNVPDTNSYSGTVHILLETVGGAGEGYFDGGVFQRAPFRAETGWYEDASSIAGFGRIESILLEAAMTSAQANARSSTVLDLRALPKIEYPEFGVQSKSPDAPRTAELSFTALGYWATLNWRYSQIIGSSTSATHVAALVAASEFVTAGKVAANTLSYGIDSRAPLRIGDILADIAAAGDGTSPFSIGVYANRELIYEPLAVTAKYIRRGNQVLNASGTPIPPHHVRPGYVLIDDQPMFSEYIRAGDIADAHFHLADEVEFSAPGTLKFSRERAA